MDKMGQWFLDMEKEAMHNPEKYFFLSANSYFNAHNLPDGWFDEQRKNSPSDLHFNAEILNIPPPRITDGFYPGLNPDKHYYTNFNYDFYDAQLDKNMQKVSVNCLGDSDHDLHAPIVISIDWGGKINCMVVGQDTAAGFDFTNCFHVKKPDIIDDLITKKFLPYYGPHEKKVVHLWYDRSGNSARPDSNITYAQQVEKILTMANWTVQGMVRGLDPPHSDKYLLWAKILSGSDNMPTVRFNRINAKNLIISCENAEAKEGKNGIEKNKNSERSTIIPGEEATHLSDAADIIIFGKYAHLMGKQRESFNITVLG